MLLDSIRTWPPVSLALLLLYGSASRFAHGATSTVTFYQYQNDRRADDGSPEARLIPVFDLIVATAILIPGWSRKLGVSFVAATIGSVAVYRYVNGLPCRGDVIQAVWSLATAIADWSASFGV